VLYRLSVGQYTVRWSLVHSKKGSIVDDIVQSINRKKFNLIEYILEHFYTNKEKW